MDTSVGLLDLYPVRKVQVEEGRRQACESTGPAQRPTCLGLRVIHPSIGLPNPSPGPYFVFQFLRPQPPARSPMAAFRSCIRIPESDPEAGVIQKRRYYIFFKSLRNLNIYDTPHQDVPAKKCNSCHPWLLKNDFLETLVALFIFHRLTDNGIASFKQ